MMPSSSNFQEAHAVYIPEDDDKTGKYNDSSNSNKNNSKNQLSEPVHVATIEVGDAYHNDATDGLDTAFLKGESQPPAYQDIWFARAFYGQLVGVVATAVVYAPSAFDASASDNDAAEDATSSSNNNDDTTSVWFLVTLLAILFVAAMLTTLSLFQIMTKYAHKVVTWSFFAAPVLLLAWAVILGAVGGEAGMALAGSLTMMALFFALISACVYRYYKSKIPFAASTLQTALAALAVNKGLLMLSMGSLLVAFLWSGLWVTTMVGIVAAADAKGKTLCLTLYPTQTDVYTSDEMCDTDPPNGFAIMFMVLSFYWTHQVITNCMHCTTAGTVGSWWFSGFGDPSMCSRDVTDSAARTVTYSFGSVCFGSLIVAILQLLEAMARNARQNRDAQLLALILECLLSFLRAWVEYFNSWAFVYVALYGYDYKTAGKNVFALFKNRGWSSFVADRLVFRVLYSTQLAVGICCGGVAALVDIVAGPLFPDDDTTDAADSGDPNAASHLLVFFAGALVGLLTSSVSLFVIESAVRSVIVCFAESPAEFEEHHPQLCEQMRNGWAAAYPDIWNEGDYNERFVKATVISYDDDEPSFSDDPLRNSGGKASSKS